jgi:hypothetical protein
MTGRTTAAVVAILPLCKRPAGPAPSSLPALLVRGSFAGCSFLVQPREIGLVDTARSSR